MQLNQLYKYFTGIAAVLLLLATGCNSSKNEITKPEKKEHHDETEVELTADQFKVAGIQTGSLENRSLSGTIRVNGKLDVPPQQMMSISVPMGGFLRKTDLLQGSYVRKGQLIATIENQDFIDLQQNYLETESKLEFASNDYQRQQDLQIANANSQKTLQQAKATFQSLKAQKDGLGQKLRLININPEKLASSGIRGTINLYAPINGYVTEVNANLGKFVTPSEVLFEIVDTQHLHAELTVYEKDVPRLKIGQKVRFTLANETAERIATVYLIGREISKERTVQVHCHIDREDKEMLPGMYLTALVESVGRSVPSLPDQAIVNYEGRNFIFLVEDSHKETPHNHKESESETEKQELGDEHSFKMVEVKTGVTENGFTEIQTSQNFNQESKIVIVGAYSLLSKLKNAEGEGHSH